MANKKSDIKAKSTFVEKLTKRGFLNARVCSSPADICAEKDGVLWYFEIKMTRRSDNYFGAATLTEWKQAIKDPEHFRFVVAQTLDDEQSFTFTEYTPEEFMEFSTVPPFKIFFNVNLDGTRRTSPKRTKSIGLSREIISAMASLFDELKEK